MLAGQWQDFRSEYLTPEQAVETMLRWQALSQASAEPAGFNAPELQLPILKHSNLAVLQTITYGPDLLLAVPVTKKRLYNANTISPLAAGGTMHVAKGLKQSAIAAFLNFQEKPFLLQAIAQDGPIFNEFKNAAVHFSVLESWARAGLKPQGTYADWLQTNFDQKRRKEFKRLRNRLGELGTLQTDVLKPQDSVDSFVADFLTLEASGWKGKKGTAIAANPQLTAALSEAAKLLHEAGKLRFWSLKLNGKAIASLYAIVEGDQAWLGKIGYDESFSKYSPGALIILDCTESFFAEPNTRQIDSSAIPDHPLIDRIWRDRLPMACVFVAPSSVSKLKFYTIVAAARAKLRARSALRDIYYKLKRKKRS